MGLWLMHEVKPSVSRIKTRSHGYSVRVLNILVLSRDLTAYFRHAR